MAGSGFAPDRVKICLPQPLVPTSTPPPSAKMSSFLNDIISDTSNTSLTLPMQQNTSTTSGGDGELSSDTEPEGLQDSTENRDVQHQASTQNSRDAIAAFTINTARNLRLTTNGENSLIRFSQCIELDTRSALIYQQATLIKMSEAYSRLESAAMEGSQTGEKLDLPKKIKDEIDYRARLVIVSPSLSRYRALGKDLKTGPGVIVLKWLRTKSGINKKYLEGEAYQVLRSKIKALCRYARSEVKDVIRHAVEERLHITVLLKEMAKAFEKWFRSDMSASVTVAVRFALLRQVYDKDPSDTFWTSVDKTLTDIRQNAASGNGLSASEILVKCLDADEQNYPPSTGSASAQTALASVQQSEDQLSMDEFVSTSDASVE
ncbi:hypothetical protein BJ322DRAFT_1164329 [Thelephora terrestris]|uniref:Uncharacterized protein n=1 Tax=Thelephora terrestris TaxID=56493 RepID=A0A9P6H829_9AGAM|nr:hypothetical protein BJ322DRAFT_1164329 [Thelephora terrestris]